MKSYLKISVAILLAATAVSCGDKRTPSSQYMPDMYVAVPYESNGAEGLNGEMVDKVPVAGTIARGQELYEYPNTTAGYELAKANLKSPLEMTTAHAENGKKMYGIYCAVCHNKNGDGNGVLAQRDKFNGIPNYKDRDLTSGSIYHVIMYGKNLMGSHASQLTTKERWEVVQYVEALRNK